MSLHSRENGRGVLPRNRREFFRRERLRDAPQVSESLPVMGPGHVQQAYYSVGQRDFQGLLRIEHLLHRRNAVEGRGEQREEKLRVQRLQQCQGGADFCGGDPQGLGCGAAELLALRRLLVVACRDYGVVWVIRPGQQHCGGCRCQWKPRDELGDQL